MNEGSRFYDLRKSGAAWSSSRLTLPERLVTPEGESLERVNLPSASLCADFLASANNVWAGIVVAVTENDVPAVWRMFEKCSSDIVRLIRPEEAAAIERYKTYGGFGWVEVCWASTAQLQLVEVQTNEVLWYVLRRRATDDPKIVLLGLENVAILMNEPESPLVLP